MSAGPAIVLSTPPLAALTGGTGVPLALAFGAGLLATLNPCGFALLPAYVSYVVGQDTANGKATAWAQALRGGVLGLPLAAGFLLVFVVAGGILAAGGRLLAHLFPWMAILVGLGLVALGGWTLLSGRVPEIPGLGPLANAAGQPRTAAASREDGHMESGWVSALLVFAAYAAGMLLVLLAVAMAASTLQDLLRHFVLPLLRWVQPVAALLVIAAGVYIVIYQLHAGLW